MLEAVVGLGLVYIASAFMPTATDFLCHNDPNYYASIARQNRELVKIGDAIAQTYGNTSIDAVTGRVATPVKFWYSDLDTRRRVYPTLVKAHPELIDVGAWREL